MSRRPSLRFLLDEGVPVSVGAALEAAGHEVIYFNNSGLAKSAADAVVCVAAEVNNAVLVAHDGDMKVLAKGHGITPARFRSLSLLRLNCRESASAKRVTDAMSLIEQLARQPIRSARLRLIRASLIPEAGALGERGRATSLGLVAD